MGNIIRELNEHDFYNEFFTIFPFLSKWIVTPNKRKGVSISSMEKILIDEGISLNYFDSSIIFEDIEDNFLGLKILCDLFFSEVESKGDILFFTPFSDTKNNNKAIVMPFSKINEFLFEKSNYYYKYGLDVSSYDLFFYLYDEKEFFGFEQCSQPNKTKI